VDPELLEPPEPSFGQWWADPEFEPEPEEPCCCDVPEWEFAASAFEMLTPPTMSAPAARTLATTVRLSFDIGGHLLSGTDAPAVVWTEAWPSLCAAWQSSALQAAGDESSSGGFHGRLTGNAQGGGLWCLR
jgi:hypothetical protein